MPTYHNNIVLGSGEVFLALFDSNGVRGGFRRLGETPGFSISITTERTVVQGSDRSTRYKLVDKVIEVERSGSVAVRDISPENRALWAGGEAGTVDQVVAAGETDDIANVVPGLWYLIGASSTQITGVRNITSVSVADTGTSSPFVEGADYELDLVRGRIYIVDGGGISAGDNITVTYDVPANSRSQVVTTDQASRKAALHFVADNSEGENADLLLPYIEIGPDGEMGWKDLENAQELGFTFQCLTKDSATPEMIIDGEPHTP